MIDLYSNEQSSKVTVLRLRQLLCGRASSGAVAALLIIVEIELDAALRALH